MNEIWRECPGGDYMLYTEDSRVARTLRGWNAFRDGRIREMAEYYDLHRARPIAYQFRFGSKIRNRIEKTVSGATEPTPRVRSGMAT